MYSESGKVEDLVVAEKMARVEDPIRSKKVLGIIPVPKWFAGKAAEKHIEEGEVIAENDLPTVVRDLFNHFKEARTTFFRSNPSEPGEFFRPKGIYRVVNYGSDRMKYIMDGTMILEYKPGQGIHTSETTIHSDENPHEVTVKMENGKPVSKFSVKK